MLDARFAAMPDAMLFDVIIFLRFATAAFLLRYDISYAVRHARRHAAAITSIFAGCRHCLPCCYAITLLSFRYIADAMPRRYEALRQR